MNTQSIRTRAPRSALTLPAQALPIRRDQAQPARFDTGPGLEAAQSACSGLKGLARQMCYATNYGISV
jgi:hypothetical protein